MQTKNSSIVDGIKYTGHAFGQMRKDNCLKAIIENLMLIQEDQMAEMRNAWLLM